MRALFTSFPASDYATSKHFYEQVVGLPVLRAYEGRPHRFTDYDLGRMILKLYKWTQAYHGSGHSGLFIETENFDDVVARNRGAGARTTGIEVHGWGGRCCSIPDPFGNVFDLIDARQKGNV